MRPLTFGLLGAGFLAVGVTAVSGTLHTRSLEAEAEPPVRVDTPTSATPTSIERPDEGVPTAPSEPETATQQQASNEPAQQTRRTSSWRSRRYRYPAPSWSPDEWAPPEGPVRIALQVGHWRANEAPDELDGLRYGGTRAAGLAEWEVNYVIAERTGAMLEKLGYEVDILPAVVPPDYLAHLFIAIHADGAADIRARGYRIAAPSRDYTGRAEELVELMRETYGEATGLRRLPDTTRRMRNYYAFNVRRYEHSLDPRTIAIILETGFLTSPTDREVIVDDPDRVARGIVDAVTVFPVTSLEQVAATAPGSSPGTTQ